MTPLKPLILLILALFCLNQLTFSQEDSIYYSYIWKRTSSRDSAAYVRHRIKTDSGWFATHYTIKGEKTWSGLYEDDSMKVPKGTHIYYGKDNAIYHFYTYANGKLNGPEAYYYPDGKLQAIGANKDGEADGEWSAWYPGGKPSGSAVYANGKQVSAKFLLEDGSPNTSAKIFMQESAFQGGAPGWMQYMNSTFKYPKSAIKHEIQGIVVVQFKVMKDGSLEDISIIRSVEKSLDEEALRVIKKSPNWTPAYVGGLPVVTYKKQPIVFRLE